MKRKPQKPPEDVERPGPQDAIAPGVLPAGAAIVLENDPRLQRKSETEKELEEDVTHDRKRD
jgi:hypothetical protein